MRFTTRPELRGTFGAASSTHWLASQAAMSVLERGGNAFDAAFAAGMVLQVAEPHLNGPGGDCPIILHKAATRETRVICGQGPLPGAATVEAFTRHGLTTVPGTGLLAAVVPGAFGAWLTLLRDYGTWSFADAMELAVGYAERGVPLVQQIEDTIAASRNLFETWWPSSAAVFLPGGTVPRAGALFANPALAATWRRLIAEAASAGADREAGIEAARRAWYQGFVAEEIDRFCRQPFMDVSGEPHAGLLTGADMHDWLPPIEAPVEIDFAGHRVLKCGFWSQGPVLLQALRILDGAGLQEMDPEGADFVHWLAEAKKLAYADRETYYGDPDFVAVPGETLLSRDYAAARRALIDPARASRDWRPGDIAGFGAPVDYAAACARKRDQGLLAGYGGGEPTVARFDRTADAASGDTCHLDVIDRDGNMVSITPSGGWLQSSPVIPALGFPLGTRAQMVWLDPASPNAPAPGKRPRTTLTPTMVLRDDDSAYMACGTPGGDQQDQWQLAFLIRHLVHGMNLQEAIDAPGFHSEHWPNSFHPRQASPAKLVVEGRFDPAVRADLIARGHALEIGDDWSEGRLAAAAREEDGLLKAAANPRGMQGYAVCR